MRYAGTERDDDAEGWFRLGTLEVTSTFLVLLVWVVTLVIYTVEGVGGPVNRHLYLTSDSVLNGEVWRVITWPVSHVEFGLSEVIGAAIFGLFGWQLERQTGRRPFGLLLGWSIVIIGLSATVLSKLLGTEFALFDFDLLGLAVLLLFIAEHPTAPFFFGIPAWAIGAVIVAIELVNDLANRDWTKLLTVIVASGLIALVARRIGLLSQYERIPEVSLPSLGRSRGAGGPPNGPRRAGAATDPRGAGPDSASKRSGPLWGKRKQEDAEIVQMPTTRRPPASAVVPDDVSADDLALDLLLDKISEGGLDSLTAEERQSLDDLRARRRKTT